MAPRRANVRGLADWLGVDVRKRYAHQHAGKVVGLAGFAPMGTPEQVSPVQAMQALSLCGSVVYAMRVPGGLIKIGYTSRLAERRNHLKGEMLAVMFGDLADEQTIHASLTGHVHHGREWYYPTPAVMAVVNDMRQALGLEPLAA